MQPVFLPEAILYLKTDPENMPRICTAYKVTKYDITYELSCGTQVSWHYEFEITTEVSTKTVTGFGNSSGN